MNTILFSEKRPLAAEDGKGWLIPFRCSDIANCRLDEPAYNRSQYENELAITITERIRAALAAKGYSQENGYTVMPNFRTMMITVRG